MSRASDKTVLMVAGEFPPVKTIGRIRTVKFIEHLKDRGWRAIVLTVEPNGTSSVADPALLHEVPADTEVIRVAHPDLETATARLVKRLLRRGDGGDKPAAEPESKPAVAAPGPPSLLDRMHGIFTGALRNYVYVPDSYNLWAWKAAREAAALCKSRDIDLIFTTLPPFSAAWIGYALRRRTGLPWVADYRDLWTGDVLREWLPPMRRSFERWLERRLMRRADAIIAVSEQKTAFLKDLLGARDVRWTTLTNGYDPEEFADVTREATVGGDQIRFLFTGRLFKNRRGYAFAEALGQLKAEQPALVDKVRVRFLGGVAPEIRQRYDEITSAYGLSEQFDFAGDVPHAVAKQAQVDTDRLLLIVDTGATSDGVIPGKLFEYVAARRPIFALTDPGATAAIVTEGKLGVVVDAEDVAACKDALSRILAEPVPERLEVDEAYLAQFDRRVIASRLADLFDAMISTGEAADGRPREMVAGG